MRASLLLLILIHSAAQANDCRQDVEDAVHSCHVGITNAKNSNVSSFGGASGSADAGVSISGAADQINRQIAGAISSCQQRDLESCVNKCNQALRSAQGQPNPQALTKQIRDNMNACDRRVSQLMASAEVARAEMANTAMQGVQSHNAACQGDCQIDRQPTYDPAAGATVQQVADDRDLPIRIQMPNGEVVDGTYGQYQVYQKMFQGTTDRAGKFAPRVYPQGQIRGQ